MEEQAEFFRLAAKAFNTPMWSSGYGGKPWAQIARAPLAFLTGKLSPSVFADHAFDLQHNNGSVFGKHNMQNLKGAQLVCSKLGISENDFYNAIKNFEGAANRLELVFKQNGFLVFKDFINVTHCVEKR